MSSQTLTPTADPALKARVVSRLVSIDMMLDPPTVWFARLKQRRRDIGWLRYL